jgi:hypothetical protein
MQLTANRTIALLGILSLAVAIAPAAAQQSRLRIEWNDFAPQYRRQIDRRVTVICPPSGAPSTVYGTGVYSDNSSVCGAATHAGAIDTTNGGVVTIVIAPGMSSYQGSTQNRVTSLGLGMFAGSFRIETGGVPGQVDWSTTAVGLSLAGKPLTLICPPGDLTRVWGTDTYHEDSSICSAAAHAGVITSRSGGAVTIQGTGPQTLFAASDRNGVTSLEWKVRATSFSVSASSATPVRLAQPLSRTETSASSVPGVTVSATGGLVTTEGGGSATFTVRLNTQPQADVTIPLTSSVTKEGTVSPTSLTFTAANWMTPQTVTARGVDDPVVDGDQPYMIRTGLIQALGDSSYHNYNAADVGVINNDDDVAAIAVRPTAGLATTEAGGTATFLIVLRSQPTSAVTLNVSSSNSAEGTVSPSSVSFDATNWSTPRAITVTGVGDRVEDGDVGYSIITSDAVSSDPRYNNLVVDDVAVTNRGTR